MGSGVVLSKQLTTITNYINTWQVAAGNVNNWIRLHWLMIMIIACLVLGIVQNFQSLSFNGKLHLGMFLTYKFHKFVLFLFFIYQKMFCFFFLLICLAELSDSLECDSVFFAGLEELSHFWSYEKYALFVNTIYVKIFYFSPAGLRANKRACT